MTVRIGLLGFGRVGRDIVRLLHGLGHGHGGLAVTAIAETAPAASCAYLLKYDSVRGRLDVAVHVAGDRLHIGQHSAAWLAVQPGAEIDWAAHGVDIVVDATGRPRGRDELAAHLAHGAGRVIACGPGADGAASFDATVVVGHNDVTLTTAQRIVGLAPPEAQAAVLCAAALTGLGEIERLFCTTVRAYGADQSLADVPGPDMRRARAAAANIVPAPERIAAPLMQLVPELQGKVAAMDLRVPVSNGSMLDLTLFTRGAASVDAARAALVAAAARAPHILALCDDPIVSSDVRGDAHSAVVDVPAMMALGEHTLKVIAWYDNSWGLAHRAVELVRRTAELPGGLA